MRLNLRGETLELLPEKAFLWVEKAMLVLSDLHLGKADSLQAQGVPIPSLSHDDDFNRLRRLIDLHQPRTVVFLGDLIHDRQSWSQALETRLAQFFQDFSQIDFKLILGNHDRHSRDILRDWPLELIEDDWRVEPFIFAHGHQSQKLKSDDFEISGHVHPVIKISQGPVKLRLPCFVEGPQSLVVPSFGILTGGFEIERKKNEKVYAVADKKIILVGR